MKRRLTLETPCYLRDVSGRRVARLVSLTLDFLPEGEGGKGGEDEGANDTASDLTLDVELNPNGGGTGEPTPRSQRVPSEDIDRVLTHYHAVMNPRRPVERLLADEEARKLVAKALRVATPVECCAAIDGCRASAWHMGENANNRKYNKLSQILKGRQGKETTRERIDFFLEKAGHVPGAGGDSAAEFARVRTAQKDVLDAWEFPGDELVVRKGEEAAAWLEQNGWRVDRDPETGRPKFIRP